MDGWKYWEGKKVFIISKNSSHPYTGEVIEVDDSKEPLIWITIIDKYGSRVQLVHSEILTIKEDAKR